MFGSYEDNIIFIRRKIPTESEHPIIIGNKTKKQDIESIDVNIDSNDEKQKVQNSDDDKW